MCQADQNAQKRVRQTHPEYVARQRWEKKGGKPVRCRFAESWWRHLWDKKRVIFYVCCWCWRLLLGLEKSDLFAVDLQAISEKKNSTFFRDKVKKLNEFTSLFPRKNCSWTNKENSSSWGLSECGIWTFARTFKNKVVLACVFACLKCCSNSRSCSVSGQDRIGHWYHYGECDMLKISSQLHFPEVLHKQLQLPSLSQADSCQLQGAQAIKRFKGR